VDEGFASTQAAEPLMAPSNNDTGFMETSDHTQCEVDWRVNQSSQSARRNAIVRRIEFGIVVTVVVAIGLLFLPGLSVHGFWMTVEFSLVGLLIARRHFLNRI